MTEGVIFHEEETGFGGGAGSSVEEEEDYIRRLLDFSGGDVGVWLLRKRGVDGVEDEGGDTAPQDVGNQ